MYHRERRKMKYLLIYAIVALIPPASSIDVNNTQHLATKDPRDDNFDNNIIDFDDDYSVKFNKKYDNAPWRSSEKFNKESHKYTVINENTDNKEENVVNIKARNDTRAKSIEKNKEIVEETTSIIDYSVIPLELITTTENVLISIIESTTEPDLTVIPLSTTKRSIPDIIINQTVTLPASTQSTDSTTEFYTTTIQNDDENSTVSENNETTTTKREITTENLEETTIKNFTTDNVQSNSTTTIIIDTTTTELQSITENNTTREISIQLTPENQINMTKDQEVLKTNSSSQIQTVHRVDKDAPESHEDVPIFTELDTEEIPDIPEDYYDSKDVVPTMAPKTDALSVIFGLAGSVVESVAERVVPKGIFDLFKRMQKQNEALEAERLRSREENGGLGQFTRGILKSISSGISKPLSQLMAGVRDIGSLDTDRGFVGSVASGVTSVANSVVDAFKDRVQAIYPGTVWCGDGHSATARSSDLGLFFFTDTCCRQHDACKLYIASGETKYGLTNTGLFTRSHCSCDIKFRDCLRRTNSLVSGQIGLTYFNVLGPQCFRRAHPIVRCVRRTRITGQKCEEYELDFTKPKMWQWFDNETF